MKLSSNVKHALEAAVVAVLVLSIVKGAEVVGLQVAGLQEAVLQVLTFLVLSFGAKKARNSDAITDYVND